MKYTKLSIKLFFAECPNTLHWKFISFIFLRGQSLLTDIRIRITLSSDRAHNIEVDPSKRHDNVCRIHKNSEGKSKTRTVPRLNNNCTIIIIIHIGPPGVSVYTRECIDSNYAVVPSATVLMA